MTHTIVSFTHVGKVFAVDGGQIEAIQEFNLEIAEGEFVASSAPAAVANPLCCAC